MIFQNAYTDEAQACMRMRKLGKGQSVVFCIPEEVKCSILELSGKHEKSGIDVSDVLRWAVSETWMDTRRSMPLWATQGQRFERQCTLWNENRQEGQFHMFASQAKEFLEPESQTLEHRYRPRHNDASLVDRYLDQNETIQRMLQRCHDVGNCNFASTQLQEEQERELSPEIEQERQVQKPAEAKPKRHKIHPDMLSFVSTGMLKKDSDAYKPAFTTLKGTSAASYLDVSQFPSDLCVTHDFATTVKTSKVSSFISDAYQRPVQWIITSCCDRSRSSSRRVAKNVVIISPYEANQLLPEIRKSEAVTLHIYAPRQNPAYPSLDKLTLYNVSAATTSSIEIPDNIRIQLGLFAGQLYLGSYIEYQQLCDFLGVAYTKTPEDLTVANDGFILGENERTTFSRSPLKFLDALMCQVRKDCQAIDKTHVGKILSGVILHPSDFQPSMEIPSR